MAKFFKEMWMKKMKMAKNMSLCTRAKELGILWSIISEFFSKFQNTRILSDRPRCCRPWKLLHWMVQKLIRTAKAQPKKTVKQVMDECELFIFISVDSTKHILYKHELKGFIEVKKPALTEKHLKARLSWSKRYELWETNVWNKTIFSD